jgi:hypothetical protein
MRTAVLIVATMATMSLATVPLATMASAQDTAPESSVQEWAPVPPLGDASGVANYCVHGNLIYSMGDVLCEGLQALVCVPAIAGTGGRSYWSSVPVTRGEINWAPPAHCGK